VPISDFASGIARIEADSWPEKALVEALLGGPDLHLCNAMSGQTRTRKWTSGGQQSVSKACPEGSAVATSLVRAEPWTAGPRSASL